MVGERGLTLSGGQRQRIAIARALLVDPRILILDDATASVDASTEARIKRALREVMRGRTTIIIAHRSSTIALAERIVVLDEGRIDADGDHESLLAENAIYREIHDHGLVDRTFVDLDGDRVLTHVDEDDERAVAAPRASAGAGSDDPPHRQHEQRLAARERLPRGAACGASARLGRYVAPHRGRRRSASPPCW